MRQLTRDEVDAFAARKGVRKIAVENFLGYLPDEAGLYGTLANLRNDATSYGWNAATVRAIKAGVELAWKG